MTESRPYDVGRTQAFVRSPGPARVDPGDNLSDTRGTTCLAAADRGTLTGTLPPRHERSLLRVVIGGNADRHHGPPRRVEQPELVNVAVEPGIASCMATRRSQKKYRSGTDAARRAGACRTGRPGIGAPASVEGSLAFRTRHYVGHSIPLVVATFRFEFGRPSRSRPIGRPRSRTASLGPGFSRGPSGRALRRARHAARR